MNTKLILAPSILSADFTRLGEQITLCEQAGADWIHVDVMDGAFVPNITVGPLIVAACRRATALPLEVHLMIERPERHLEAFAEAGASSITVHVETCPHLHQTLQQIKSLGVRAGVTLNPSTPSAHVAPVLHMVDVVLVMTVNPGFGGQQLIPETLPKVEEIRRMLDTIGSPAHLEVDGGISVETIALARAAGATAFVAGHSIFDHPDGIVEAIKALRAKLGAEARGS
jgi:ribulose-phosphate 3-epimerase